MKASEHKQQIYYEIQTILDEENEGEYTCQSVSVARQLVLVNKVAEILKRLDKIEENIACKECSNPLSFHKMDCDRRC